VPYAAVGRYRSGVSLPALKRTVEQLKGRQLSNTEWCQSLFSVVQKTTQDGTEGVSEHINRAADRKK
jgi:hypothetical protein